MIATRIKRMAATAAMFGALFVVGSAAAMMTEDEAAEARAATKRDATREIAIMSRILEKKLGDELKDDVLTANMFQRGVQGFHVPGVGALFFVNVKFAVASPPAKTDKENRDPDDLWNLFEDEMAGKPSRLSTAPFMKSYFHRDAESYVEVLDPSKSGKDKDKIDRLKKTVLEVIGDYGDRMKSLGSKERIIVLVNGGGSASPVAVRTLYLQSSPETDPADAQPQSAYSPKKRAQQPSDPLAENLKNLTVAATGTGLRTTVYPYSSASSRFGPSRRSVLIIQVECADLADKAVNLAGKADIVAYCY